MITVSTLRSALAKYEKNIGFFETTPEIINSFKEMAKKPSLSDDDELLLLQQIAEFSPKDKNSSKAYQLFFNALKSTIAVEKIAGCKILHLNQLLNQNNIGFLLSHEYILAPIGNSIIFQQDQLDLLIESASGIEDANFLKIRTTHIFYLMDQLSQYEVWNTESYDYLSEAIQINKQDNIATNSQTIGRKDYEWATDSSRTMVKNACLQAGLKVTDDFFGYEFEQSINSFYYPEFIKGTGRYLKIIQLLMQAGICTETNAKTLFHAYCGEDLTSILIRYSKNNLLTEENFNNLCQLDVSATYDLNKLTVELNHFLSQELLDYLLPNSKEIPTIRHMFKLLKKLYFFTPDLWSKVVTVISKSEASNTNRYETVIQSLDEMGYLKEEYLDLLLNTKQELCNKFQHCMYKLGMERVLNIANLQLALNYQNQNDQLSHDFIKALGNLHNYRLLDTESKLRLSNHPNQSSLIAGLIDINHLSKRILKLLFRSPEPHIEATALNYIGSFNLLHNNERLLQDHRVAKAIYHFSQYALPMTQFELDMLDVHAPLFNHLISRIPERFIGRAEVAQAIYHFSRYERTITTEVELETLCLHASLFNELLSRIPERFIDRALIADMFTTITFLYPDAEAIFEHFTTFQIYRRIEGINQEQNTTTTTTTLNSAQSTHTKSVHESVSESALRLKKRYGAQLTDNKQKLKLLTEIIQYIDQLTADINEVSNPQSAAKRLIKDMDTTNKHFWHSFKDPVSQLTNQEMLILSWIAIHDSKLRICDEATGKERFVSTLYEIRRGYNLNEEGDIDNGKKDAMICTGGAFNKIVEKLLTVHPDVSLKFITKEGAILQLQGMVTNKVKEQLKLKTLTATQLSSLKNEIDKHGVDSPSIQKAWKIAKLVIHQELDDYQSVFQNPQAYDDFIDAGIYAIDAEKISVAMDTELLSRARRSQGLFEKADTKNEYPNWLIFLFCIPIAGQLGFVFFKLLDSCFPCDFDEEPEMQDKPKNPS